MFINHNKIYLWKESRKWKQKEKKITRNNIEYCLDFIWNYEKEEEKEGEEEEKGDMDERLAYNNIISNRDPFY